MQTGSFNEGATSYLQSIYTSFNPLVLNGIESLANNLREVWQEGRQVFICGNGGSAANAIHLANDFHYGVGAFGAGPKLRGIRVEALPANTGILTCLANDTGYENIFSNQIEVKGQKKDMLIVLSGSGNSENVVKAIKTAKLLEMKVCSITAYTGGKCKILSDISIHFPINDMQIAEDTQLIVGHLCMQWLRKNKPTQLGGVKNERN